MLIRRSDIEATILRAGGTLYQLRENGTVSNLYNAELVNKTTKEINFEMRSSDPEVKIQFIRKETEIKKGGSVKVTFFVIKPQKGISKYKSKIEIQILANGKQVDEIHTNFIAPPNL